MQITRELVLYVHRLLVSTVDDFTLQCQSKPRLAMVMPIIDQSELGPPLTQRNKYYTEPNTLSTPSFSNHGKVSPQRQLTATLDNKIPILHQSANSWPILANLKPICTDISCYGICHQRQSSITQSPTDSPPICHQSHANPTPIRLPTRNWAGNKFTTGTDRSVSTEDDSDSLGSIPVSIFFTIPLRIPDQSDNPMTIPVQGANHKPIYWQSTTNPQIACQSNINLWRI